MIPKQMLKMAADYEAAYLAANPTKISPPPLNYERGWWTMDGHRKIRTAELLKMTDRLRARVEEQKLDDLLLPRTDNAS